MALKKDNGFSLIEMIVVLGIMGALIGAAGPSTINFIKMMNKVEAKQDAIALGSQLQTTISNKSTCEQSLGLSTGTVPFNLTSAAQTNPQQGFPVKMNILGEVVEHNRDLTMYPLHINHLTLNDAVSAGVDSNNFNIYKVSLNGSFTSLRNTLGTPYMLNKKLGSFFIKVDSTNNIRNCFSLNANDTGSIDDLMSLMCSRSGGQYNTTTNQCEGLANTTLGECPPGQFFRGVASTGARECATPTAAAGGGGGCLNGDRRSLRPGNQQVCTYICSNGRWVDQGCRLDR